MPTDELTPSTTPATAEVARERDALVVQLSGAWRLRGEIPAAVPALDRAAEETKNQAAPSRVIADGAQVAEWDSALPLFLLHVRDWARGRGLRCEWREVPAAVRELIGELDALGEQPPQQPPRDRERRESAQRTGLFDGGVRRSLGRWALQVAAQAHAMSAFLGECLLGLGRAAGHPWRFRWRDTVEQMRRCGAAALPIVGLISILVGVILGYVGANQLRDVGADIFVADLVGLAVFREMGPMMTAIVLTGRTGAAFAAELGNMKLGEEIDALETFGIRAHDFLVSPRLVALVVMMPMLALYADYLGVLGGLIISELVLDVAPSAFFIRLQTAVGMGDVLTGLLKSFAFGLIVAYSGCYRGMNATRSSVGVGEATTEAVVMGILLIIVADAAFTVIFNVMGW